ncbi:hypothetical protein [Clostridioides difficile]|uniref:hypothetical protein n=1 Tax=Clostridioides difficile TaxID=1496 RepID=UPI000D1D7416|nr:hypothetical protein [Clostridioides difficile]HBE9444647.1 hypothetical protein [Clostridioides difficile]
MDSEDERNIIDSAIANYEVQAMCNVNPIAKRGSELYDKVLNKKLIGVHGFLSIRDNNLKGYEYFAYLNNANKDLLSEKVVIREVNCINATTFHVAKDLAELLLLKKYLMLLINSFKVMKQYRNLKILIKKEIVKNNI